MKAIYRTRTDSDGKVHVLFVGDLEKVKLCWITGQKVVPMVSIGSIGHDTIPMEKVHVLFVGDFEKVNLCWTDEGVESSICETL